MAKKSSERERRGYDNLHALQAAEFNRQVLLELNGCRKMVRRVVYKGDYVVDLLISAVVSEIREERALDRFLILRLVHVFQLDHKSLFLQKELATRRVAGDGRTPLLDSDVAEIGGE